MSIKYKIVFCIAFIINSHQILFAQNKIYEDKYMSYVINNRIYLGFNFHNLGWGVDGSISNSKSNLMYYAGFKEFWHIKEQKQINTALIQKYPNEKISPFYYNKVNNIYIVQIGVGYRHKFYQQKQFELLFNYGLGMNLVLQKPVKYKYETYNSANQNYSIQQDFLADKSISSNTILSKSNFFANWNKARLDYGIHANFELSAKLNISEKFATVLSSGLALYLNSSKIVSLKDYPLNRFFANYYFKVGIQL